MWPFKKKTPVFCKDCVHFKPYRDRSEFHKCARKSRLDLVTSEIKTGAAYCDTERDTYGCCGPSGKYFKRKEEAV